LLLQQILQLQANRLQWQSSSEDNQWQRQI